MQLPCAIKPIRVRGVVVTICNYKVILAVEATFLLAMMLVVLVRYFPVAPSSHNHGVVEMMLHVIIRLLWLLVLRCVIEHHHSVV